VTVSGRPRFGFTRHGQAVHAHVTDHHPGGTAYQRFNKMIAVALTRYVGTMTCFWIFCCLSLCSLPSVLSAFPPFHGVFPAWMVKVSIIALVAWVAQTLIQLVLLPALMVGQNLQNVAADARSAKTFEDVERVMDLLRLDTEGGLADLYEKLHAEIAPGKAAVDKAIAAERERVLGYAAEQFGSTAASRLAKRLDPEGAPP
jgi:hypothetical protein